MVREMDRWVDIWTNGWAGGRVGRRVSVWMKRCIVRRTGKDKGPGRLGERGKE